MSAITRDREFDWRNQDYIVIPRAVDPRADLVGHHTILWIWLQYGFGLARSSCQPLFAIGLRKQSGHSEGMSARAGNELMRGLNGGNVTRVVDLLELCGWVERHPHPDDRRAHVLSVTPNATQVLRKISNIIGDALLTALQNLSAQEIATLLRLLGQLRANLTSP